MPTSPRLTRMVLFKHGVAYLERSGPADGPFELSFKRDEMNDVLKSLSVWVARGDARVGALAFEKPEDPEHALDERRMNHDWSHTLMNILGSARGRRVRVDAAGGPHEGEVVGAELSKGPHGEERRTLLLRTGDADLVGLELGELRGLHLLEPASRADLAFYLDRRRAATSGESRTVRVAVTGQAEDLRVSYVIPAPTWRVSYRLARGTADTTLMAWAIVHNPADEDLDGIDLTLTSGQPVSFTIDLYNPRNVQRAVVEETSRALASAPTQFERSRGMPPPPAAAAPFAQPAMGPSFGGGMAPQAPAPARMGAAFEDQAASVAEMQDRGELFEYRVAQKVSLGRGASAMVPILAARMEAAKERIWRVGSTPNPDLVLSFENGSGAVLEEGPAVVYDEDVYAGEAMVPYSSRGAEVKLAFAKDLGVRCKRGATQQTHTAAVRLAEGFLAEERRREEHHELSAESDHGEPVDVTFELQKYDGRTVAADSPKPFEETSSFRRFRLTVPPHGQATVRIVEQWHEAVRFEYARLAQSHIMYWLQNRFLDRPTHDALAEVIAAQVEGQELDAKAKRREAEQTEAYTKQSKLAEQLKVLKSEGPEGQLRLRYVRELDAEQDKVNACERDVRSLREAADGARRRAAEKLSELTRR